MEKNHVFGTINLQYIFGFLFHFSRLFNQGNLLSANNNKVNRIVIGNSEIISIFYISHLNENIRLILSG